MTIFNYIILIAYFIKNQCCSLCKQCKTSCKKLYKTSCKTSYKTSCSKAHFLKKNDNSVISYDFYYSTHNFPSNGWLQPCLLCECITCHINFFKTVQNRYYKDVNINCYLCKKCSKKVDKSPEYKKEYTTMCNRILTDNKKTILKLY